MRKTFNIYTLQFVMLLLAGCNYDDPLKNITDDGTRVYISNYDKEIIYSNYKTYFLIDTVFVMTNNQLRISNRKGDSLFLQNFRASFEKNNFKFSKKNENPDLGIQISRVYNSKIGEGASSAKYFNSYWNFPQFLEAGFKYAGPYSYYEINDNIWNIEAIDLKNVANNNELKVIWNAQIRGNGVFDQDNFAYILEKTFEISSFFK